MSNNKTLKVVGSVAIVGTLATIAVFNAGVELGDSSTFLASKVDPEVTIAFNDYINKYDRSFLTKEEYKARLTNFKAHFEAVREHNARPDVSY